MSQEFWQFPAPWMELFSSLFYSSHADELQVKLEDQLRLSDAIYPEKNQWFQAFQLCQPSNVKVVLLGQDPYHGPGQAHGLSFSVSSQSNLPWPPSLKNIYKELQQDCQSPIPQTGDLSSWAKQGVLLLNSCLTVEEGQPGSHANFGWVDLTDQMIKQLSNHFPHLVFLLWGSYARSKSKLIDSGKHLVLEAPHPSPLSAYRGFFGSRPFTVTNSWLEKKEIRPINWLSVC